MSIVVKGLVYMLPHVHNRLGWQRVLGRRKFYQPPRDEHTLKDRGVTSKVIEKCPRGYVVMRYLWMRMCELRIGGLLITCLFVSLD